MPPRCPLGTGVVRLQSLLLVVTLGAAILAAGLASPSPARADDDTSTGKRVLGTFLGSVDGALIARALTLREERTPTVAMLYAGAVCGGAAIGYVVADSDDALTAMGIVMIPLAILNLVLPSTDPYHDLDPRGFPSVLAMAGETEAGTEVDWWQRALVRCVPHPAPGGARVTPVRMSF